MKIDTVIKVSLVTIRSLHRISVLKLNILKCSGLLTTIQKLSDPLHTLCGIFLKDLSQLASPLTPKWWVPLHKNHKWHGRLRAAVTHSISRSEQVWLFAQCKHHSPFSPTGSEWLTYHTIRHCAPHGSVLNVVTAHFPSPDCPFALWILTFAPINVSLHAGKVNRGSGNRETYFFWWVAWLLKLETALSVVLFHTQK